MATKCLACVQAFGQTDWIFAAMLTLSLAYSEPAVAQTWNGAGTVWNTAANWSPTVVPNSSIADVNFTGNGTFYSVAITNSVSARSLSFSNPSLSYSLTSGPGVSLSNVQEINVAAEVTGLQTINLASIATGSLVSWTGNLRITNNSAAAGTTLRIGPSTVIGKPASPETFGAVEVDGAGTTEISGSFATGPTIHQALSKSGPGTLILSNPANTYSETVVAGGTLMLGSGTAIPTNTNVYVSGGEFNIGALSNTLSTRMGILTLLETSSFRVPSGNGDYYLSHVYMQGGTMNFTGTSNFWLHVTGSEPGLDTRVSSMTAKWENDTPLSTSHIQNDSGAPLTITVPAGTTPSGIDLDAGIILSSGVGSGAVGSNPNFIKVGAGTMRLTNPLNTANINIVAGKLRVDEMANLGSGAITLNSGTLTYGGDSATTTKNLTLASTSSIQVSTPGTNLDYSAVINQTSFAGLYVRGPGAGNAPSQLTLNFDSDYWGATSVFDNAILAIPAISNIGQPSPIGANLFSTGIVLGAADTRGTLLLTGILFGYSTDRKITVNGLYGFGAGCAVGVQNEPTNLTVAGQITGSGSLIKTGLGTLLPSNPSNNYAGGTYIEAGRLHVGNDAALGSGAVTVFSDGTLRYTANVAVGRTIFLDGGTVEAPSGMSLNATGTLQGEGTVVGNIVNTGFVEPNNATGTGLLDITGNYVQGSSGKLLFFVDLFLPSGSNPKLDVTSDVVLNGTLEIILGGMGQFRGTRSFDVLDWGGILGGTFSTLQLPTFGGAFTWDTSQLYLTGILKLTGPPQEGDFNLDGTVNAADYVVWRDGLGTTYTPTDYDLWRDNFGKVASADAAAGQASNMTGVPEPSISMLLFLMFAAGAPFKRYWARCERSSNQQFLPESLAF